MKIAIIGQQDFGKAVFEAFLARGDEVAGVFCAPEKPGAPRSAARGGRGARLPVHQFASLRDQAALGDERGRRRHRHHGLRAAVRAAGFRRHSAARARSSTTRPCCRGIAGRPRSTGRSSTATPRPGSPSSGPTDGLDEGPVILQKDTPIGPDDTLGYRVLRPALPAGRRRRCSRPPTSSWRASTREIAAGRIAGDLRGLVPQGRGADRLGQPRRHRLQPDPRLQSRARRLDDAGRSRARRSSTRASIPVRTFARRPRARSGEVVGGDRRRRFKVTAQGGRIEVLRARLGDGKKVGGGDVA